jgi:hypothetical protein
LRRIRRALNRGTVARERTLCGRGVYANAGVARRGPEGPGAYSICMRDTTAIGNRTLGIVLSALLHAGYPPLLPFGDGHRYDVAFDRDGQLCRVQCKTGRLEDGAVVFKTASYTRNVPKAYRDEVDYFGVYCPETGTEPANSGWKSRGTARSRRSTGHGTTFSSVSAVSSRRATLQRRRIARCPMASWRLVPCQHRPRGYGAVGSASAWHAEGQGFESP